MSYSICLFSMIAHDLSVQNAALKYVQRGCLIFCEKVCVPYLDPANSLKGKRSIPSFSQSVGWDFKLWPVFWDALHSEPLPVSLWVLLDI